MSLALLLKQSEACKQTSPIRCFCSLLRNLQVCLTPSYMVCHWFPFLERTHCNWVSFSQTNIENKFINILELIIAFNSEDWPEWLPPQLQYDIIIVQCSYFLVPSPCLLEWLDCLKGEIPGYSCMLSPWSQQCCMLFWTLGLLSSLVQYCSDCFVHIQIDPITPDSSVDH